MSACCDQGREKELFCEWWESGWYRGDVSPSLVSMENMPVGDGLFYFSRKVHPAEPKNGEGNSLEVRVSQPHLACYFWIQTIKRSSRIKYVSCGNEEIMKEKLEKIMKDALSQIETSEGLDKLNDIRVAFLGKKGELTSVLKSMKDVAPEDRPKVGQLVNEARKDIEAKLEAKKTAFAKALREEKMKAEVIDVTLPGKKPKLGHRHPNTIALEEVEKIFVGLGYEVVEGPEVEYDYYNFEALNIPANHPAKDEQDTFYINDKFLLRTQTSSVQVRVMEEGKLPIRMIAPGRVFRSDEVDATHSPSFHQIEGLVIDKNITFADLKGTLAEFARELFGEGTKVKFRPHHFPFTEPSAEMDVTCFKCGGKGCRFCKGSGWIEILGCGMVHPHVLEMCGIDPEEYSGFAFGVGLERIALLKYEIDDMRLLYENDIRFLKQF